MKPATRPFLALLPLLLAACATGASAPGAGALPGGGTPSSAKAPGVATGKAVDGQGKPLADVHVDIVGTASAKVEFRSYQPTTDASGTYRQADLTPGTYTLKAWRDVSYNGKAYKLPLASPQGSHNQQLDSAEGIVRDFVWKISGPKPGATSTDGHGAFYGGTVLIYGADYVGTPIAASEGAEIVVKLVPSGPLMDGTAGAPITASAPFAKTGNKLKQLDDVPLGRYTVTAEVKDAGGATKPLRVLVQNGPSGTEDAHYTASTTLDFEPGGGANVRPYQEQPTTRQAIYVRI